MMVEEYAKCKHCDCMITKKDSEVYEGLCRVCKLEAGRWRDYFGGRNDIRCGDRYKNRDEFEDRINDRRFR